MKKTPMLVLGLSFLLIVLVLGFNGWMNIASLKKNHTESVVGNYVVAGGEAKRTIEYALKYGKKLDNFFGLPEILERIHERAPNIENIRLISPEGQIIYSRQPENNIRLASRQAAQAGFRGEAAGKSHIVLREGAKVHIFLPLRDKDAHWLGSLELVFDEAMAGIDEYLTMTVKLLLAVAACTLILLAAIFRLVKIIDEQGNIRRRRLLVLLAAVLGCAQMVSAVINQEQFQKIYVAAVKKNTAITAEIIAKDIERVIGLGVIYSQLPPLERWLEQVTRFVPEIEAVRFDTAAAMVKRPPALAGDGRDDLGYEKLLKADTSGATARLQIVLSQKYLDMRTRDMLLDTGTVTLISFFFMSEILIFMSLLLEGRTRSSGDGETATGAGVIRPLAFLFFMAVDLSITIIPLHTKTMLESLGGLPASAVIGLPISVEMFCAGATTLAAGAVIDRKGWRAPFFAGLLLLAAGALMSGWAETILPFIAARGVVGCGYGFGWLAMRGYVAGLKTPEAKAKGFSALNAGIYAGNICACALGAMLAERLGYSGVFFVAVFVLMLVGLFAAFFVRQDGEAPGTTTAAAGGSDWKAFIRDKAVLALIFLVTIPSALCLTGFLNYFFPVYANAQGISGANIGRAFMIYGVSIVYLGPIIGKYLAGPSRSLPLIAGACCIGVTALAQFSLLGGAGAALTAIFLFGIADSIGLITQNTYLLNLPATEALGRGKALAIFSMCKKMGQMSGPMALAWGCGWGATQSGIGLIGLLYLGAVGAFVFCMRRSTN